MKVYFQGIGGIGMSGVAGLAKEMGFIVKGSDQLPLYPPSSEILESLGIEVITPSPENLKKFKPHLVVVGNAVKRDHPEVLTAYELGLPLLSFPEFLEKYLFPEKKVLVCAGTHGKTTTTAMLGKAMEILGEDPIYLVGGCLRDRGKNYRLGQGPWAVVEGDEYPSSFFDQKPKFFHYHPYGLILTGIEYDHADVYPDLASLLAVFGRLIELVPKEGLLVLNGDDHNLRRLANLAQGRIIFYGQRKDAQVRLLEAKTTFTEGRFNTKVIFSVEGRNWEGEVPLPGLYNAMNYLAVFTLLKYLSFPEEKVLSALSQFPGVKRRQELILYRNGLVVVDDFAHHPTAVKVTLQALKKAINPEKTILVFEPRTNTSKRKIFQKDYEEVLASAEVVLLKIPPKLETIPPEERLDIEGLLEGLRNRGIEAYLLSEKNPWEFIDRNRVLVSLMSSAMMEDLLSALRCLAFKKGA